jgi:uncharacterized membrane protein
MMTRLRNHLITGAVVLVPIALTWYVLLSLFRLLDGLTARMVTALLGRPVPGLGVLVTVAIVLVTGVMARSLLGRQLIRLSEAALSSTPLVRGVYSTMKQIVDAFAVPDQTTFQRVVLVEYPRKGIYSLALVTSDGPPQIERVTEQDLVCVFLPTTPNPTSGYLLMLPRSEVRPVDISVEDGLKMVISGGVIMPPLPQAALPGGQQEGRRARGPNSPPGREAIAPASAPHPDAPAAGPRGGGGGRAGPRDRAGRGPGGAGRLPPRSDGG